MIRVTDHPFQPMAILNTALEEAGGAGALVTFLGQVRGEGPDGPITAMTLEHYPGMTEKALTEIEAEAKRRWSLDLVLILHRHGRMEPGEPIVFVATASAHRQAAYEANEFLVDWLKTKAPFWKKEEGPWGSRWVEARAEDDEAAARWSESG